MTVPLEEIIRAHEALERSNGLVMLGLRKEIKEQAEIIKEQAEIIERCDTLVRASNGRADGAEMDTKRLDWVDKKRAEFSHVSIKSDQWWCFIPLQKTFTVDGPSFRQAIDNAMLEARDQDDPK
jgi:hypothetical protein